MSAPDRARDRARHARGATRVKICGLTRLEDARAAVEAGADYLGFIFAPSPRRIEAAAAARIIGALPAGRAERVGVFVNETAERINAIAAEAGLTMVQLAGDEPPGLGERLALPAIKVARLRSGEPLEAALRPLEAFTFIMIEPRVEGLYGGTGRTADWGLAAAAVTRFPGRVFLAGGLSPENVSDAIERVRPFAVDASSSLESGSRHQGPGAHQAIRGGGAKDMSTGVPLTAQPDAGGYFGIYGGKYVPEIIMPALEELEAVYREAARGPRVRRRVRAPAAGVRGPAFAPDLRGAPHRGVGRREGLPQARGPQPHRRPQDQQHHRPDPAGPPHGQEPHHRRDRGGPARRGDGDGGRALWLRVRGLHGRGGRAPPGAQRVPHAPHGDHRRAGDVGDAAPSRTPSTRPSATG